MEFKNLNINLKELQKTQLEILIEFDRICRENNIIYRLHAGTLLGAIRHKGFIPWDDDIDVCMLRNDYEKFIKICVKELSKKYFLQIPETDFEYIHSFARIRKNNTILLQDIYSEIDMHHGIFIDVFPMDNVLPNKIIGRIQKYLVYYIRTLKRLKIKKRCLSSKNVFNTIIKLFIHYLLKPIPMRKMNKLETKAITMFKNKKTKFVTSLTDGSNSIYQRNLTALEEFYELKLLDFEDYKFWGPSNYDKVLSQCYGNYMELPPLEEREPHHNIIELCFDGSSKKVIIN